MSLRGTACARHNFHMLSNIVIIFGKSADKAIKACLVSLLFTLKMFDLFLSSGF